MLAVTPYYDATWIEAEISVPAGVPPVPVDSQHKGFVIDHVGTAWVGDGVSNHLIFFVALRPLLASMLIIQNFKSANPQLWPKIAAPPSTKLRVYCNSTTATLSHNLLEHLRDVQIAKD